MLNRQTHSQFQSSKFQQNNICRFNNQINTQQYQPTLQYIPTPSHPSHLPFFSQQHHNINTSKLNMNSIGNEQIINLEDLWQSLQNKKQNMGRIQINKIDNIENVNDEICQFTLQEFDQLLECNLKEQIKENKQILNDQPQDFGELWDNINKQSQNSNKIINQPNSTQSTPSLIPSPLPIQKKPSQQSSLFQQFNLSQLFSSSNGRSLNYNITKDYLIFDYSKFLLNCFQTNIYSYFGFHEQKQNKNIYYLYDLITKQNIIQCRIQDYDHTFKKYQLEYCLKYKICKTNQYIATCYHKYVNNGILYNLKPYNTYQNKYQDSLALIQITDGFISNNCYCNTNVFISQKYTTQPGQLKMIIGLKNGYLIANMGVNGVKSAPYNCRLENSQINKQTSQFIIRVGEGMSPLIAFAISVGRKRYIDSFSQ